MVHAVEAFWNLCADKSVGEAERTKPNPLNVSVEETDVAPSAWTPPPPEQPSPAADEQPGWPSPPQTTDRPSDARSQGAAYQSDLLKCEAGEVAGFARTRSLKSCDFSYGKR